MPGSLSVAGAVLAEGSRLNRSTSDSAAVVWLDLQILIWPDLQIVTEEFVALHPLAVERRHGAAWLVVTLKSRGVR